ncbi:MAG: Asp-tRNA(Asn)/Glu-tRNA(Gln) amidotransferase subunit GatB [Candidatus Omnitrophica bacterium]|nr:Asp-tRNA(Asn)/Glu-tRNA(Gln) amidotransferase subunit GatB [Candidatus Omnitrophota bacterium]
MTYEPVIGLEVHLQLNTWTKAFCGCSTAFGAPANTQVCPVCMGFPGTLPVLNKKMLEFAVKVGVTLNCTVQEFTKLDRKNYFYPDLPKAYQISQYDLPLCTKGYLDIELEGKPKRVGITRVHMEEDAGKLIHQASASMVDYNRTGVPLLEIVSEPDMRSPREAYAYLTALKSMVGYLDVSDCDMEKGSLRCDANISLRPAGEEAFGTKTELKNLNSFRAVRDALAFEISRQQEVLREGGRIVQETRLWDAKALKTLPMRTKEEAQDYRYFPEPDLPPFVVSRRMVEDVRAGLPELPRERAKRLSGEFGISGADALVLVGSRRDAEFAEECLKAYGAPDKKAVVNWLTGPLAAEANNRNCCISELNISAAALAGLIGFVNRQEISNLSAKKVLVEMIDSGKPAEQIIKEKNLAQISDSSALEAIIDEVLKEHTKSVTDFRNGKTNALMFLVGQVMRQSRGKANPKVVQDLIKRRIA